MEIIHYSACPVCNSTDISLALSAKDYTVSGETFAIYECGKCGARFTQDIPNPANIGKYYASSSYISHTDTSEGMVNKLYHRVRKITLDQKGKLVLRATGLQKGKLLDVGAGTGLFVLQMKERGWDTIGLEPDEGARKVAISKGVDLKESSDLFSLQTASFNAITLWHVLEHVHDLHNYLEQFRKLLTPSGKLIIAVPNYTSADAKYYGEYWAAYDVPRHLYHFSPSSMNALLNNHHFTLEKIHPQWFDSFYVSLLSEKYKTGKDKFVAGAWHGAMSNVKAIGSKEKCSSLIYVAGIR